MRLFICAIFLYFQYGESKLWSKGVVHYAFNNKDYDLHSQDIIASTFDRLEREICIKFFNTPLNHSLAHHERILYISNPKKRKDCQPQSYKFNKPVVDMEIGYKCINEQEIALMILDMLRVSTGDVAQPSSYKLQRTFQQFQERAKDPHDPEKETLLSMVDRDYINSKYLDECADLTQKPVDARRSYGGTMELTAENEKYYNDKLWPLGIVMYGVDPGIMMSSDFPQLHYAMSQIERVTCVVFKFVSPAEPLQPKNLIWFGVEGEEVPNLGFMEGNQTVLLSPMIHGAPGHNAHTLNLLMRILGVPMMSNRYDRTNYVMIKWDRVAKMKEHYLERSPIEAWLKNSEGEGIPYDFDSVTHAPANYMCDDCSLGQRTVEPIQDHLWQRTLTMGHRAELSEGDIAMLNLLYSRQCLLRSMRNTK